MRRTTWRKLISVVCLAVGTSVGTTRAQEPEVINSEIVGTEIVGSEIVGSEIVSPEGVIMGETIIENGGGPLSTWYVQAGAVILRRNMASSTVFVNDPNGRPLVTSQDFTFNWPAGPDILVGRMLNDNIAVEMKYFGSYGNSASLSQAGSGIPVGGSALANNFFADYRSSMTSVEINLRYWLNCELSVLGGLRFINWHEDMSGGYTVPVTTTIPGVNPNNTNLAAALNTVITTNKLVSFADLTNNNLFGPQIGGDWRRSFDNFGVETYGKMGLFGSEAYGRETFIDSNSVATTASACQSQATFLCELGVVGTYKVTDAISLRAGYTIMWIEGIAIVPQESQIFSGANGSLNSHSGVFLQGFIAGAEVRW